MFAIMLITSPICVVCKRFGPLDSNSFQQAAEKPDDMNVLLKQMTAYQFSHSFLRLYSLNIYGLLPCVNLNVRCARFAVVRTVTFVACMHCLSYPCSDSIRIPCGRPSLLHYTTRTPLTHLCVMAASRLMFCKYVCMIVVRVCLFLLFIVCVWVWFCCLYMCAVYVC